MPSVDPFSIQHLILSWNRSGRQPSITPGIIDTPSLAEALVTNMQFKQYASRPVMTKYLASFNCTTCGKSHVKVTNWEGQLGAIVVESNVLCKREMLFNIYYKYSMF